MSTTFSHLSCVALLDAACPRADVYDRAVLGNLRIRRVTKLLGQIRRWPLSRASHDRQCPPRRYLPLHDGRLVAERQRAERVDPWPESGGLYKRGAELLGQRLPR